MNRTAGDAFRRRRQPQHEPEKGSAKSSPPIFHKIPITGIGARASLIIPLAILFSVHLTWLPGTRDTHRVVRLVPGRHLGALRPSDFTISERKQGWSNHAVTLAPCIIYEPPWSKRAGRLGILLTPICLRDLRDCAPLSMPLVLITRRENFAVHTDNQIQMTLQHLTLPIQRLQLTIPEEIIHSRGEELNFSNHAFSIG